MVFSSLVFLCVFLPTVFLLYTIIPVHKVRNGLLIVFSLVFYAYGEPIYVFLMIISSLVNFLCALFIGKSETKSRKKLFLIIAVALNLGTLAVFKYTGMLIASVNSLMRLSIPSPEIVLPIGISFYTFQALSYVIDVYRGEVGVQKNYFRVLLYISFFPQLIAGPIVKYRDIADQIEHRSQSVEQTAQGFRRFICGMEKKVLIANTMGQAADIIFSQSTSSLGVLSSWLGAVAYLFQIFYDFSGYSDMAIGLGKMFGFTFKENFLYPYGADSVRVFWRRWHISLSTWFKEYLYIPLGGNRKGKARTALNRIIVFFFTGLWHGANWTFVLWGLWHGMFLMLEQYLPVLKKLPKAIGHIYTMLVVLLGFVLFRSDTISFGFGYIGRMFSFGGTGSFDASLALQQLTPWFILMLVAAVVGCAPIRPLADRIRRALYSDGTASKARTALDTALYCIAFLALIFCLLRLSPSGYNPFIYFRF